MRIAIVSPYSTGPMRGNIVTVRRIADHLVRSGVEVLVLAADAMSPEEMLDSLHSFSPDLIHAFHAYHCGPVASTLASKINKPLIITIISSDMNEPEYCSAPETCHAMTAANSITCFSPKMAETIASRFPESCNKITVIPQGVEPPPLSDCCSFNIPADAFVILLPAALRPVKQVEFAIYATAQLTEQIKTLRLLIAGGDIDPAYSSAIRQLLEDSPHVVWLHEVPYPKMGSLYKRADIVLNCSAYEEMPNSLLEAMALGRPVLANNIPGNRSLVEHGKTGWLYNGKTDFANRLMLMYNDPNLRRQVGAQAQKHTTTYYSPALEAKRYIDLYNTTVRTECLPDTNSRA